MLNIVKVHELTVRRNIHSVVKRNCQEVRLCKEENMAETDR